MGITVPAPSSAEASTQDDIGPEAKKFLDRAHRMGLIQLKADVPEDAAAEAVFREINFALERLENGDYEVIESFDD